MARRNPNLPRIDFRTATLEETEDFINTEFFQKAFKERMEKSLCIDKDCYNCFSSENKIVIDHLGTCSHCERAVDYVISRFFYLSRKKTSYSPNSSTPDTTSEEDFANYKDTRNFMRVRGYKKCYMCGGEL